MNNKDKLNNILKIRDIRKNLGNLNIKESEKEVLRKSLNYYEDLLDLEITKNNLNKKEFEEHGILNDIEITNIPKEENTTRYNEFAKVSDNELVSIINDISNSINNFGLDNESIIVVLKSIKEYSEYLKSLNLMRKSNQEIYNEIMNIDEQDNFQK